jgi:hypothetical protein
MVFDPQDALSGEQVPNKSLGLAVKLPLFELFGLHGWEFDSKKALSAPRGIEFVRAIAEAHTDKEAAQSWSDWIKQYRRPDNPSKPRSKTELNSLSLPYPTHPSLSKLVASFKEKSGQGGESLNIGEAREKFGFADPVMFCKWLEGTWLEGLVLQSLIELSSVFSLHDTFMSLKIAASNASDSDVDFELDVAAMRGYQLFAFSCGVYSDTQTGGKAELKKKLFEAYTRAQQIGGDETCVALVCCADDSDGLKRQVVRDIHIADRVKVFGRTNLLNLTASIQRWIEPNIGKE